MTENSQAILAALLAPVATFLLIHAFWLFVVWVAAITKDRR